MQNKNFLYSMMTILLLSSTTIAIKYAYEKYYSRDTNDSDSDAFIDEKILKTLPIVENTDVDYVNINNDTVENNVNDTCVKKEKDE